MNIQKIRQIAVQARADFEADKIKSDELRELYFQYNPIKEMDIFMKRAKRMFPHLNCGLISCYLQKRFPKSKIVNGKYKNNKHTFLMVEKSIIIDITADQYEGPKVYVGPLQQPWSIA